MNFYKLDAESGYMISHELNKLKKAIAERDAIIGRMRGEYNALMDDRNNIVDRHNALLDQNQKLQQNLARSQQALANEVARADSLQEKLSASEKVAEAAVNDLGEALQKVETYSSAANDAVGELVEAKQHLERLVVYEVASQQMLSYLGAYFEAERSPAMQHYHEASGMRQMEPGEVWANACALYRTSFEEMECSAPEDEQLPWLQISVIAG